MTHRIVPALVAGLTLASLLSGCGGADTADRVVGPQADGAGVDHGGFADPPFTFHVYRTNADGQESLRWVGTVSGPLPSSPEPTLRPYVGYGQPFRVEWRSEAVGSRIFGEFFRPTPEFEAWVPAADGLPSATHSFAFENRVRYAGDPPPGCNQDLDCIASAYIGGTETLFEVGGTNALGLQASFAEGRLELNVGYPPRAVLAGTGLGLEVVLPVGYSSFAFAEGDTLPIGSRVRVHTRLADPGSGMDPDSMCCNVETPESVGLSPSLRLSRSVGGESVEICLGALSQPAQAVQEFVVGPFEASLVVTAVDSWGALDIDPLVVNLVGGFAPRVVSIEPSEGTDIVLRSPSENAPWPENEYPYAVSSTVRRYWNGDAFTDTDAFGSTEVQGNYYGFTPRFLAVDDARESGGGPGAFAFEWSSTDSQVALETEWGSDLESAPIFHDAKFPGELDVPPEGGIRIFVPLAIWFAPQLYEPGSVDSERAAQGDWLRARLGEMQLAAMARMTAEHEIYQTPSDLHDPNAPLTREPIGALGRRSAIAAVRLRVRLGIDPSQAGAIQSYFPLEPGSSIP